MDDSFGKHEILLRLCVTGFAHTVQYGRLKSPLSAGRQRARAFHWFRMLGRCRLEGNSRQCRFREACKETAHGEL